MFGIEFSAVFFSLSAALIWGASDFTGGLSTRRNNVFAVIIIAHTCGLALLLGLIAIGMGEQAPSLESMAWGALAGLAGLAGLATFYSGLAHGRMGVVAPVTGIVAASIPVAFGFFIEGLPLHHQLFGFGLGLIALWVVSRGDSGEPFDIKDVRAGLLAGAAFGVFFVLLDRMSEEAILWPLVGARLVSLAIMIPFVALRMPGEMRRIRNLPLVALVGILDTLGNAFYSLATKTGRLDTATVLTSLYPAITVLLAWILLKEHISLRQWGGVIVALVAVALISL